MADTHVARVPGILARGFGQTTAYVALHRLMWQNARFKKVLDRSPEMTIEDATYRAAGIASDWIALLND